MFITHCKINHRLNPGWEISGSTRGNLPLLRSKMPLVLTQNCAENYRPGAKNYEKLQRMPLVLTSFYNTMKIGHLELNDH